MINTGGGFFLEDGAKSHEDAVHEQEVNGIVEKILDEATHRRRILVRFSAILQEESTTCVYHL